jgi:hypothetical protein
MVGSRSIKRKRKRDLRKRFQVQLQEKGIREVLNSNARENVCVGLGGFKLQQRSTNTK